MAAARELALCQLYRHTFVPYGSMRTHTFMSNSSTVRTRFKKNNAVPFIRTRAVPVCLIPYRRLRQTVRTHRTSVHQAAKLVAALLRVARVTAGLAESDGSLPPGL